MTMVYDDFDDYNNNSGTDLCPSCGILLGVDEVTNGCCDPMGCGVYLEYEGSDEDDDEDVQELNFD